MEQVTQTELKEAVKETVLRFDPEAKVILYGSRARGDAGLESDWDFLMLLSGPATSEIQHRIRFQLYEIEWATGEVITSIFHSREEWEQSRLRITPFHENVTREGIEL